MLLEGHGGKPRIGSYYTPMALHFSNHIKFDCVIYDCMDELSAFKGAPADLTCMEAKLMQKADIMFTGGQSLFEAKKDKHRNVFVYPSSIDRAHFTGARLGDALEPSDQKCICHPRVGFFGVIDERTDLELLE